MVRYLVLCPREENPSSVVVLPETAQQGGKGLSACLRHPAPQTGSAGHPRRGPSPERLALGKGARARGAQLPQPPGSAWKACCGFTPVWRHLETGRRPRPQMPAMRQEWLAETTARSSSSREDFNSLFRLCGHPQLSSGDPTVDPKGLPCIELEQFSPPRKPLVSTEPCGFCR